MALAIDSQQASSAGFGVASGTSPQTFSFTNTAGTLLYFLSGVAGSGSVGLTLGATSYGGAAMTKVVEKNTGTVGNGGKVAIWRLLSPATGSNTVSFAATATGSIIHWWGGCISFTGNDMTTPEVQSSSGASAGVDGTTASGSLSGVASGNYTIAVAGAGSSMSGQTQTLTWAKNIADTSSAGNGRASVSTSSGSVTHGFTISVSDSWAAAMIEVAAAAGAVVTTPPLPLVGPNAAVQRAANWCKGTWERRGSGIYVRPRGIVVPRAII